MSPPGTTRLGRGGELRVWLCHPGPIATLVTAG
jgi:hypothetical protein